MPQTVTAPQLGIEPKTYIAGAAIARGQLLKRGADLNTVIPNTADTIVTIGVAADDQDTAGRTVQVHTHPGETVLVRAGAAFALDAKLSSDASGRAITATGLSKQYTLIAREAATAADQLVSAELLTQGLATPAV
jgi:hypothetical protein